LQRAAYLVEARGLSLAEVKGVLREELADPGPSRAWVLLRPKPQPRQRRRVVTVALPRSATRISGLRRA